MTEASKWELRDIQATAVSADRSGNSVILAGKRCLAIKRLDRDDEAEDSIKKIPRQSKYDVAGAEWCQTQQGQRLCAISVRIYSYNTSLKVFISKLSEQPTS
jgi:WD repeat-containing protein 59